MRFNLDPKTPKPSALNRTLHMPKALRCLHDIYLQQNLGPKMPPGLLDPERVSGFRVHLRP